MNQSELIDKIARNLSHLNVSKTAVSAVLNDLGDTAQEELKSGGEVAIPGIGKLKVATRSARTGRNPATGETMNIPAKKVPHFTAAKALKDAVAG